MHVCSLLVCLVCIHAQYRNDAQLILHAIVMTVGQCTLYVYSIAQQYATSHTCNAKGLTFQLYAMTANLSVLYFNSLHCNLLVNLCLCMRKFVSKTKWDSFCVYNVKQIIDKALKCNFRPLVSLHYIYTKWRIARPSNMALFL